MHRWYHDDGVFMGSVVEVEGVLAALQQALPPTPMGLELNMRETTVWGPGLVTAASPLAAATRLHLEEGTGLLGVPIQSPLYASAVEAHLGKLGAKFAHTCSAVGGLADTKSAHALVRSCLGPAKVQYALRTLPVRQKAAFAEGIAVTQRATWNTVVGTSVSAAAWVQATLPISEGSCGVASASDVAPVARLAWILQLLALAEALFG